MKGMKGIQRSSHPELTRMVKLLRKQNLGLHDEKKVLVAMNAELVEALEAALDYIDKSPCDLDIYPEQLAAWVKLGNFEAEEALAKAKELGQ